MKFQFSSYRRGKRITFSILVLSLLTTTCLSADVYVGEPLGEAMFDLDKIAVLIGHDLSGGSPLKRTDVFRFHDGRLLAVRSVAERGQPFSIAELKMTASAQTPLNEKTPSVLKVQVPEQ